MILTVVTVAMLALLSVVLISLVRLVTRPRAVVVVPERLNATGTIFADDLRRAGVATTVLVLPRVDVDAGAEVLRRALGAGAVVVVAGPGDAGERSPAAYAAVAAGVLACAGARVALLGDVDAPRWSKRTESRERGGVIPVFRVSSQAVAWVRGLAG